jgi:hypothetical protein
LYFLVVCALTSVAVLFAQRLAHRNAIATGHGAQLLAAAEAAVYATVSSWSSAERSRQAVGSSIRIIVPPNENVMTTIHITRLTMRVFSITAESRLVATNIARRVNLLVRLPIEAPRLHGGLVSAVGVIVGPQVRFVLDTGQCSDSTSSAVLLSPNATITLDADIPPGTAPSVTHDSLAADSGSYLRIANAWWSELASRADIQLGRDARVAPAPSIVDGRCVATNANWGAPLTPSSACGTRVPLVFASGDLTIDGGAGQGVLLVDGHLAITGPFTFSGQIVARRGIETLADNITISGAVYAWRESSDTTDSHAATNEVILTHTTTLRRSRCDAEHGIASWLQPHRVRERAWSELF